ncbi:tripartite tricarboxylate transporter substrate binding protein [Bradyrhizobium sp. OAE829]|uniref:Bug family tripartite tricarboxylate transporter substrate binding protein n=1 Tax=Bradyrhizobium sp. OAE829 TaxID=2663807 RepID=UPI00178B1087
MKIISWVKALALSVVLAGTAHAAGPYPSRPVLVVVGYSPGGATDSYARVYAQKLGEKLGQPFIVENRPGAGGNIAATAIAQASGDGYTILMAANYLAINAALNLNKYDFEKDLTPIALIASNPNLLVVPESSPIKSVSDLIAAAKQKDSHLTFGSPGTGGSVHMAGELFKATAGVDLTHVPYRGISPAEVDLMAGRIDLMFGNISTALPLVESKRLRAIAVTGKRRVAALPNIPTLDESGLKGFDVEATFLLVAPATTPPEIVTRLSATVEEITKDASVQKFIAALYADPRYGGSDEAKAYLRSEFKKWQSVVQTTGLKVEN